MPGSLKTFLYEKRNLIRELFFFGLVGGTGFLVDFGTYTFLSKSVGIYYLYANVCSVALAIVWTFLGNKYLTFKNQSQNVASQGAKFLTVSLGGLALQTALLYFFVDILPLERLFSDKDALVGKAMAVAIVAASNYVFNKFWTFRSSKSVDVVK